MKKKNKKELDLEDTNSEDNELEKNKEDNHRRNIIFLLLFLILIFFATFGITYTLYKGDSGENEQEIITDKVLFNYSDALRKTTGIDIVDAYPMSDELGKNLYGNSQYFDFNITATSKSTKINYQLLVDKNASSTLENESVRVYLTQLIGNTEKEIVLNDFSNLKVVQMEGKTYYLLYEKELEKGIVNYVDNYRLRMWVKEDAVDYSAKKFSIKVNVVAVQVGE